MKKLKDKFRKDINKNLYALDLKVGLTNEQVQDRKNNGLINKTKKQVSKSYLRIIYDNVFNFFNILLFIITAAMIIAQLELLKFFFDGILVLNIGIGLYQDIRARRLIDKLKVISSVKVNVLRDGKIEQISAEQVVLSDIVEIKQGSQLVCDGTIVDGSVELNESLLTGESNNISKTVDGKVFSGSFVTSGKALYRVDHIGKENYAEKLQQSAKKFKRVKSEILSSLKIIFKVIGFFVVTLGLAQIIWFRKDLTSIQNPAFRKTVEGICTSLVGMLPIGMYLLTSVTLAVGVIRLAKRNMLTQDMYCIETLARVDTLCLDKTGTLTDGNLNVTTVISTSKMDENELSKMIKTLVFATKDENPTAVAIINKFSSLEELEYHSSIPFNSKRKYSAVMLKDGRSIIMGAREFIPHSNKEIDELCKSYEKRGLRVLVLAQYNHVINIEEELEETQIIGILVLEDHIRDDAPANIKWFKENSVDVRIITGDNPESASEIARRAGIDNPEKFVSLEGMSINEVKQIAKEYKIFGRVSPEQKQAIVEALKEAGHTVAMTGDGVNDILALRVADCSIAMASGSDASKNVAHLVSLDSSFSSLPDVVKEGRRVINNLQRSVSVFLVKTVFAIVLTTFFLFGLSKLTPRYPFVLTNMFIWEILGIGIGSLFLSLQPNDEVIKSKFLINIAFRVAPAAFIQIGLVVFFFLFCQDFATAQTLSVLAFSIFSLIIFARVCLPFDIYRIVLFTGLTFVAIITTITDILLKQTQIFGLNYSLLTSDDVFALFVVLSIALMIYLALSYGSTKLHELIDKKREVKRYENIKRSKTSIRK